ncbi:unnamed protein product [Musa hybrid cultivar]
MAGEGFPSKLLRQCGEGGRVLVSILLDFVAFSISVCSISVYACHDSKQNGPSMLSMTAGEKRLNGTICQPGETQLSMANFLQHLNEEEERDQRHNLSQHSNAINCKRRDDKSKTWGTLWEFLALC